MKSSNIIKKISVFVLSAICAASFSACGDSSSESSSKSAQSSADKLTSSQSEEDSSKVKSDKVIGSATVTIDMTDVNNHYGELPENLQSDEFIPLSGYPLQDKSCEITEGETVLDLLLDATESEMITVNYVSAQESGYNTAYVKSINNISEGTMGDNSGWCFEVNGETPMDGCDKVELSDGDKVRFYYVCDYNTYFADVSGATE